MRATRPERYQGWAEKLMRDFGYAGRRALFTHAKSCDFELHDNVITINPTNQALHIGGRTKTLA